MLLTIMIPTYNRQDELKKNLVLLSTIIRNCCASEDICVVISDNCSSDYTERIVRDYCAENKDIVINYYKNEKNLGINKNFIAVIDRSSTEFGMMLGDDDYISEEYLKKVIYLIKNKTAGCIIPSYYNIDSEGNRTGKSRDLEVESRRFNPGFDNCITNSWRGHQISGLVFNLPIAKMALEKHSLSNVYPQIYITADQCMKVHTFHLTDYPVKVSRPSMQKKDWGYGDCGLIPDIFENYRFLDGITETQRAKLERKVLFEQYWRIAMYIKKGIKAFFRCLRGIQKSENTTRYTALWLPGIVFCAFTYNGFKALFSGKLLETLKTKVDI